MANDIVLGIKLTADGSAMVGEVRMSAESLRNLADETGKANVAAQRAAESQRTMGQQIRAVAAEIGLATVAWKGYQAIKERALEAARYQTLGVVIEVVGRNAGYTATQMHDFEKALQRTGISMIESRQTLSMMAQANIDLAESTQLARVAQDAAVIGNLNSSEAFNRLVYGIQSAQTDVLRTIGINVNFENSYKKLAAQLHKNTDDLTEHEKTQARTNAVIERGSDIAGTYEAAMGTAGKQLKSMERYLEDLRVKQGEVFNEALTIGVMAFTAHLRDASHQLDEMAKNKEIERWGHSISETMVFAANWTDNLATSVRLMVTTVAAALAETKALLTGDLQGYVAIAKAWDAEIATLTANYNRMDRAAEEFYAKKHAQEQKAFDHQREFTEKSLALQRLYAGYDAGTQRSAQVALAQSYYPHEFPARRPDAAGAQSGASKRDDFSRISEQLRERAALLSAETAAATKLTEAQRQAIAIMEQIGSGKAKLSVAQKIEVTNLLEHTLALDAENTALERSAKNLEDSLKAHQEYMAGVGKATEDIMAKAAAAEAENAMIGMTAGQLAAVTAARYDEQIAVKQAAAESLRGIAGRESELFLIEQQIEAMLRLRGAETARPILQEQVAEHKQMWESIDNTAHDTFVSIMDGGKDVATRLKEAFKNGFFDWLYSMTAKKWIVNISGAFSAGGAAGMANAASGVDVGGGLSWLSAVSGGFDALGTTLANSATDLGVWAYNHGAQAVGKSLIGNAGAIGTAGSYLGAGMAGIGIGTAIAGDKQFAGMGGSTLSTIGAVIGGFTPLGPLGSAIGGAIGGALAAAFGSGPRVSGTTTLAGRFSQSGFTGQYQTPWSEEGGWFSSGDAGTDITPVSAAQRAALGNLVGGAKSVFDQLIAVSGEAEKSIAGWTFAINRQVASQAQQKQLTLDIATSMGNFLVPSLKQFKATGESLADTAVRMRDELALTDTIANMIGKDIADAFGAVGLASMSARDNLVGLLGGITQADATMQSYYQNFFGEAERNTNAIAALDAQFKSLGLSLPDTREGYRALIEAQDLGTASGRALFASLINLNGAFASAIPLAEDISQKTADIAVKRTSLEIQLMEAGGDAAGALAAKRREELNALDESLRPLQSAIYAAEDRAKAERESAEAIARAADTARTAFDNLQASIQNTSKDMFATREAYDRFVGQTMAGYAPPPMAYVVPSTQTPSATQRPIVDTDAMIKQIQELRAEQEAGNVSIAKFISDMGSILRKWDKLGMPPVSTV